MGHAKRGTTPDGILHPGWGLALAVLVVNDHLLKGSGLLPELLTGKLSDFAGLLVAPVLLSALLGHRAGARKLAFVATALVFSAINLSPTLAAAFDAALGGLGLSWRTFVDPTDLVALAALPVAARWLPPEPAVANRRWSWPRRAFATAGALACAASSPAATWQTPAFIVNHTEQAQQVRLRFPDATLDCDRVADHLHRALGPELFGPGVPVSLAPKETLALTRQQIAPRDFDPQGFADPPRCEAVLVTVEGLEPMLVFWSDLSSDIVELSLDEDLPEALRDGALVITEGRTGATLAPGSGLVLDTFVDDIGGGACAVDRAESYGFSEVPEAFTDGLVDMSEGRDGCVALGFEGRPAPVFVCAPIAELPFVPGDELFVTPVEVAGGRGLSIRRGGASPATVTVFTELTSLSVGTLQGRVVDIDCGGRRLDCGTYVVSGALEFGDGTRLAAGVTAEVQSDYQAQPVRVRIGRAERYIVGSDACEVGQDLPGARIDLLIVEEK